MRTEKCSVFSAWYGTTGGAPKRYTRHSALGLGPLKNAGICNLLDHARVLPNEYPPGLVERALRPQTSPKKGVGDVWGELMPMLPARLIPFARERRRQGIEKYGVPLQGKNGRDTLFDAFQEEMDRIAYYALVGASEYDIDIRQWARTRLITAIGEACETAAILSLRENRRANPVGTVP